MKSSTKMIIILMAIMIFAALSYANDGANSTELPAAKPVQSLVSLSDEAAAKLRPLPFALREVLLNERAQLEELHARHDDASNALQRLEIQKEIEVVRAATEISLVNVQITHARGEGRTSDVEVLEIILDRMTTAPADRTEAPKTNR